MITVIFTTIGKATEQFIHDALISLAKVPRDIISQIIVVDNSMDAAFHESLKAKFFDYKLNAEFVYNSTKLQMGENWNTGLSIVKNSWVLYHHDDDILLPSSLSSLASELDINLGFISYDYFILGSSGQKRQILKHGLNGILETTPKYISTIFNTKFLIGIGGWEDCYGYFLDFAAMVKLNQLHGSKHINRPMGLYRVHAENASSRDKRQQGYGNFIHRVIFDLYQFVKSDDDRRKLVFHVSSYAFPHKTLVKRILSRVLGLFGFKVWFQ